MRPPLAWGSTGHQQLHLSFRGSIGCTWLPSCSPQFAHSTVYCLAPLKLIQFLPIYMGKGRLGSTSELIPQLLVPKVDDCVCYSIVHFSCVLWPFLSPLISLIPSTACGFGIYPTGQGRLSFIAQTYSIIARDMPTSWTGVLWWVNSVLNGCQGCLSIFAWLFWKLALLNHYNHCTLVHFFILQLLQNALYSCDLNSDPNIRQNFFWCTICAEPISETCCSGLSGWY